MLFCVMAVRKNYRPWRALNASFATQKKNSDGLACVSSRVMLISRRSEISHVSSAPPAKRPCLSSSQPLLSLSQLPPSITPSTQQPAVDPSSTAPPPPSVCQPLSAVGSSSTQQAPANSPSVSSQLMSDQPNRGVQLSVNPDLSEPSCSSSPPVEVSACLSLLFAINCYTTYNIIMINIRLPFLTNVVGVNLSS